MYKGNDDSERKRLHEEYKKKRQSSKMEISKAMSDASEKLYDDLETPEGAQRIHKIASQRKYLSKDMNNPKYIEDSNGTQKMKAFV